MDDSAGVDIVGRAIAILEEEVRSWARLQRNLAGPSERVPPPDDRDQGGDDR